MIIQVDTSVRKKWHKGNERTKEVSTVVIHGAGEADSTEALIKWMLSGKRKKDYIHGVGLFHYVIDRNGIITEIINPEFWTFHSSSGLLDESTIGIELINGNSRNFNSYTMAQYESLFLLIFDKLMIDYPTIGTVVSHGRMKEKYSGQYKYCPGKFDWLKLEDYMDANGYSYRHNDGIESYWGVEKNGKQRRGQNSR